MDCAAVVVAREEMIRTRAYFLWQAAGSPDGRSDEFWRAAEAVVSSKTPEEPGSTGREGGKTKPGALIAWLVKQAHLPNLSKKLQRGLYLPLPLALGG